MCTICLGQTDHLAPKILFTHMLFYYKSRVIMRDKQIVHLAQSTNVNCHFQSFSCTHIFKLDDYCGSYKISTSELYLVNLYVTKKTA